jgi:hypothetical protein
MVSEKDTIHRRTVIEHGNRYVYLYTTDANGKVLDEEVFTQPYRLDRQEVHEEAKDIYDLVYDSLNELINFPSASDGDGPPNVKE